MSGVKKESASQRDKTDLAWWNENIERGNLEGVSLEGHKHNTTPGSVYRIIVVDTTTSGEVVVQIQGDDGVTRRVDAATVEPVFKKGRRASGFKMKLEAAELEGMLAGFVASHREFLRHAECDTRPADPRSYLPAWAWPEYWQPNQKQAVIVEDLSGSRQTGQFIVGEVYTVEFARQRSPDGQALLSVLGPGGMRKTMAWTYVLPYEEFAE